MCSKSIIIDGYNLLHGADIVVETGGPYTLGKSRQALLNFLIATLPSDQLAGTTVVFDAKNAPPGLPSSYSQAGITILFADRKEDADILIARLVKEHSAPKSLLVVSSDHGVQRAAKRRKARCCDSDRWFAAIIRQRNAMDFASDDVEKPLAPLSAEEVSAWVTKFDVDPEEFSERPPAAAADPNVTDALPPHPPADPAKTELEAEGFNPFPDGYGEDLLP